MTDAQAAPVPGTTATNADTTTTPQQTQPAAPAAAFDWNAVPGMDDDAKGYVTTKGWKAPTDLLGSYRNLEKLVGVGPDKIVKLPVNDDQAAWNEVYAKLGRPETADKYGLPLPEGDKGEFAKVASEWFYEEGLSVKQGQGVTKRWNEFAAKAVKAQADAVAERGTKQIADLKTEWGSNFDAHAKTVDDAAAAFGMTADDIQALKQAMGPGGAMKFLFNVGSKLGVEQQRVDGDTRGGITGGTTPAQAVARIADLKKDKGWAERFAKGDVDARSEMERLNKAAYPGTVEI